MRLITFVSLLSIGEPSTVDARFYESSMFVVKNFSYQTELKGVYLISSPPLPLLNVFSKYMQVVQQKQPVVHFQTPPHELTSA